MSANPLEPVNALPPAPAPTATPQATRNSFQEKTGGDWGKAETTYFNAVNELKKVHGVAENAVARANQLEQALAAFAGGGRPATDPLVQLQEDLGLPAEPLAKAIDSRLEARLESRLNELFAPIINEMQATESLQAEIQNFDEMKASARNYMREQPEIAEVFNAIKAAGKHAEAWKFAIRSALIAQQNAEQPRPSSADIGLPGGRAVQGRSEPQRTGVDQRTVESQALDYGRNYGDMTHYAHERLKGTSVERAVQNLVKRIGLTNPGSGW